jgi:hypothetical protein
VLVRSLREVAQRHGGQAWRRRAARHARFLQKKQLAERLQRSGDPDFNVPLGDLVRHPLGVLRTLVRQVEERGQGT